MAYEWDPTLEYEEERSSEMQDKLTATPIPSCLCGSGGGGRQVNSEAEPEKKREVERVALTFGFISCYPILI